MKPETIERIKRLIDADVSIWEASMIQNIKLNQRTQMLQNIDEYQKAYAAQQDFYDWLDEREIENETED